MGRKGVYNRHTLQEDPTRGALVSEYMGLVGWSKGYLELLLTRLSL